MTEPWFKKALRRNVLDMHITDYDASFLTEFDPKEYAELLALAGAQSAVVYAHSHVGLSNYPTKFGKMHPNLNGRDIFGQMLDECHKRGICVVAYYSLIFNSWAYDTHADWRIIDHEGNEAAANSRYGVCCPNSPYRDHAAAETEELSRGYAFDGVRFDMTFWPNVCYCPHCLRRFDEEVGGQPPRIVDWLDPKWVAFQRSRERWLVEFARMMTDIVRTHRPGASIEHQSSGFIAPWWLGVATDLVECNDFLEGDFYGGHLSASFVQKLLMNMTPQLPYGFESSSAVSLTDHTTPKPDDVIRARACSALSHGGAFIFIDAVDPVGTLNHTVYERLRPIFAEVAAFDPYLGGEACADVAVYFSTESKFDPADNGKPITIDIDTPMPHRQAALNVTQALIHANVPFTVIARPNLDQLAKYRIVVLPNVLMMDEAECEAFRQHVRDGGALYASMHTSYLRSDGARPTDFMLGDVLGVSHAGQTRHDMTYIAPTPDGQSVLPAYSPKYPLCVRGRQLQVRAAAEATVLGTTVLPYTVPQQLVPYASIHSNPPGAATDDPAIVQHTFGRGKTLYVAGDIERDEDHRQVFVDLLRQLQTRPFRFESNAPKVVEITAFNQPAHKRYIINFLNFQEHLPPVVAHEIEFRLNLDAGQSVRRVVQLPDRVALPHDSGDDSVTFTLPRLELFAMCAVEYA